MCEYTNENEEECWCVLIISNYIWLCDKYVISWKEQITLLLLHISMDIISYQCLQWKFNVVINLILVVKICTVIVWMSIRCWLKYLLMCTELLNNLCDKNQENKDINQWMWGGICRRWNKSIFSFSIWYTNLI